MAHLTIASPAKIRPVATGRTSSGRLAAVATELQGSVALVVLCLIVVLVGMHLS